MKNQYSGTQSCAYDMRAFLINGRRELLICGEVHYSRIPASEWARVLDTTKAAGINCVASYIFWNWHEPHRDQYDFAGGKDISRFLDMCKERGLYVLLRSGPYCCAEWNYGGFPLWLREEPGIEFRTFNQPYLQRMEKYYKHLFTEIIPYLITRGGPLILVQLENEYANIANRYGEAGSRYLEWTLNLGRRLGIDVPILMCEGGAPGAIEALNGFSLSDERIEDFRKRCPHQPLIWTELWTGWYNTWGYEKHVRDSRNIAYYLLRFIAAGGSAWNYYMWHGGTNFGRTSMFLQATEYGFDSPLDEWGRETVKSEYLKKIHRIVLQYKDILLDGHHSINHQNAVWTTKEQSLCISWIAEEKKATIADSTGKVLFDTESCWNKCLDSHLIKPWTHLLSIDQWKWTPEPFPCERLDPPAYRNDPEDQLLHTKDESDYCWYVHHIEAAQQGAHQLHIPFCGDFIRIYVNGLLQETSTLPLKECRGKTVAASRENPAGHVNMLEQNAPDYACTANITLNAGINRIEILCCALGLIKGDWMISGPMTEERKGIWSSIYLDGKRLEQWRIFPGLAGPLYGQKQKEESVHSAITPGWAEGRFSLLPYLLNQDLDFRLDLAPLDKGLLYINGQLLSRYWLIESNGYGMDEGWHDARENGIYLEGNKQPTQRYYRVPSSWLKEENTITIFEEGQFNTTTILRIDIRHC